MAFLKIDEGLVQQKACYCVPLVNPQQYQMTFHFQKLFMLSNESYPKNRGLKKEMRRIFPTQVTTRPSDR